MSENRRDSLTLGDDATSATVASSLSAQEGSATPPARHHSRSTSPAKRRASEMDDEHGSEGVEKMEVERPTSPAQNVSAEENHDAIQHPTPSSSKSSGVRQARGASVDMLGNQPNLSSDASPSNTNTSGQSDGVADSTLTNPSSVSASSGDKEMDDVPNLPAIDDQVKMVMEHAQVDIKDRQIGYAISSAWLSRVLARSSEKDVHGPYEKDVLEGDIGPVDNSPILLKGPVDESLQDEYGEQFIPLRPGLAIGREFEILPQTAYDMIIQWYGLINGQEPIKRYAHATNPDGNDQNVQYELYPPVFTLRKLRVDKTFDKHRTQDAKANAPRIVASRSNVFQAFLLRAKNAAGIPKDTKVKMWRVLEAEAVGNDSVVKRKAGNLMPSPPISRESSPAPQAPSERKLLMDIEAFTNMAEGTEREMIDMKDETNNDKYNGSVQLGTLGLAADQVLILEEQVSRSGKEEFVSDSSRKTMNKASLLKKGGILSQTSSGRTSPAPTGMMTRGRHRAQGRSKGTVGLTNLGNTCYMNSALQCIRATQELSTFFLMGQWTKELNASNPLGYHGQIAKAYAGFLESIYASTTSFTPRNFKQTLGKHGPQFSGYGQQDSQEFMSFLVDGLHEDLNRIDKKPYIENPDSDDARVNDVEYVKELGETYRANYRARNDSVVTDLFNGFYKNTMVCPVCDKVSITFDPYSLLTLQLPIEHSWQHQITLIPLHGKPILIDLDMDKHSTVRQMKEYIASKVPRLEAKRLMMAEVFSHKFYRTTEDKQTLMELNVQSRDDMVVYELDDIPTNFPAPKKKQKRVRSMLNIYPDSEEEDIPESDSPLADRMMVPVFHRAQTTHYGSKSLALTPGFITLTREEASNYKEIYRKILARTVSLTTREFLADADSEPETSSSENDQDAGLTPDEDGSSTAERSVQARSIESEDGMVDVSMGDDDDDQQQQDSVQKYISSTPKYHVLQPGNPIPENLATMFELKYMPAGSEMVTTGWSSVDAGRNYATLKSREPKPPRKPSPQSSESQSPAASTGSSDVDELPEYSTSAQPSFTESVESEPEEGVSRNFTMAKPSSTMNPRANGNKRKNKHTYSKKGKPQPQQHTFSKRRASESSDAVTEIQAGGNPSLVRLGEAIIVDWNTNVYDALFGGHPGDSLRGEEARKSAETLEDVELEQKRQKRTARKKNGITLDECFTATAKGEILTEENAWYCNRCKELRQAEKTLEIWTAPDILVIHLKRFSANRQFRDKIDVLVDFPIEGLNLNDKVGMTDGKDLTYDLFAVDNHYGGLGGGHYTAFAQSFIDHKWYEYNDSQVSQRQPGAVVTPAAYLLFYRRRSNAPLGSPALQKLVDKYWNKEDEEEATNSDSSSRATSPSGQGKGQRLDGRSLNGSSSALVVAGAARPLRGGDGMGATLRGGIRQNGMFNNTADDYDADADADGEEDEAIAMPDDDDADAPLHGPELPPYGDYSNSFQIQDVHEPSWSWMSQGARTQVDDTHADELDSVNAADGDDEIGGADVRLAEDFGDDVGQQFGSDSVHQNSPVMQSMEQDIPDLVDAHRPLAGNAQDEEAVHSAPVNYVDQEMLEVDEAERFEDAPVTEIRINDESPGQEHDVGGSEQHLKKE